MKKKYSWHYRINIIFENISNAVHSKGNAIYYTFYLWKTLEKNLDLKKQGFVQLFN